MNSEENSSPHTQNTASDAAPTRSDLFAYRPGLEAPVIGMESEFSVIMDGKEVTPEEVWRFPSDFISVPLLNRSTRSNQLPTGGALYFDKGVLELVTPVIEIAPRCTTRMVRSMWEQISFVREHLTAWQQQTGHDVKLKAFSSHFNISFELSRDERSSDRTVQKLALLLAYLLPIPVMVLGTNRRSTGVGVRPRRERIEITLDFTPDPGLMLATAAFIVGVVRDVIAWPSYRIEQLASLPIELPMGVDPGKHTTRKGWLMRDYHFERSPFTSNIDAADWTTRSGRQMSLREIGWRIARFFRSSIRKVSDPFSYRILFSVLEGRTPSLLDLADRPRAYDDIGSSIRWGTVLPELENFSGEMLSDSLSAHIAERSNASQREGESLTTDDVEVSEDDERFPVVRERATPGFISHARPARRSSDLQATLAPPWSEPSNDRREGTSVVPSERRRNDRRRSPREQFTNEDLDRSRYENVFIQLASGRPATIDGRRWVAERMRGWYEADVVDIATGEERRISIDQLAAHPEVWE